MHRFFLTISVFISSIMLCYGGNKNTDNAIILIKECKYAEAFTLLQKAALTNDVIAQYYLAQCFEHGIGVEENETEAFNNYRRTAERGFVPAMHDMARFYLNGIFVEKNDAKAKEWENRYLAKRENSSYDLFDIIDYYNSNPEILMASEEISPEPDTSQPLYPLTQTTYRDNVKDRQSAFKTPHKAPEVYKTENPVLNQVVSDVDENIPTLNIRNEDTFALIIANEDYQDVAMVPNAINDGSVFSQYCEKTFGIPAENIHFIKNATLNNIKRELNLIGQIAEAYNGNVNLIVYYAGHGVPDEATSDAYILPVDGYTSDLSTCLSLSDLYRQLGDLPSKKVLVFMDACFSGSLRGNGMLQAARGVALKVKPVTPKGKMVIFSAAQGDETAYPYEEQKHGLFTYFLLKKIQESFGRATLDSLSEYIIENVKKKSLVTNSKIQTPSVIVSGSVGNDWTNWTIF